MTIEILEQALEKIHGNDPISIARRRSILAEIYALMVAAKAAEAE